MSGIPNPNCVELNYYAYDGVGFTNNMKNTENTARISDTTNLKLSSSQDAF